jgi:hypothetical protein
MGMNTVVLIHNDSLDAIEGEPSQAMLGITQAILTGQKNDVPIRDGNRVEINPITVMPSVHSRDVSVYVLMENGIHAVTAGTIQRNPLLLENFLRYLREELYMKIPKNPFD